jgi:hypothetical protein
MILLLLLLVLSCKPPAADATDLGNAATLTATHLEAHLGAHVTVHGEPTPTRVVENGPCLLYYLIPNRRIFVNDCTVRDDDALSSHFTGRLDRFSNLPQAPLITRYYRKHFDIEVPDPAYVIHVTP